MHPTPEYRPTHFTELTTLRTVPIHASLVPRPAEAGRAPATDTVDLVQLWETIVKHSRLIIGVTVAVFLLVMAVTAFARMEFQSSGRLYLGELETKTRNPSTPGGFDFAGDTQGAVSSELEILKSRTLVEQAILESGLNATVVPNGADPPRYLTWLLSRRDQSLLDRGLREVRVKSASVPVGTRKPLELDVRFTSERAYEVRPRAGGPVARGELDQPLSRPEYAFTLLAGEERAPRAGAAYALTLRSVDLVTDEVLDVLKVTAPKNGSGADQQADVVTVDFTARSPRQASQFLNALMLGYLKERQSWKTEDATAAENFVTQQLASVKASLDDVEAKLATYRRNNAAVVLDSEAKALVEQIGRFEEQRVAAQLDVAALSDVSRSLKGHGPPVGAYLVGEATDKVLQDMATSLSKAKEKEAELEARFNDAAPDVKDQHAQVNAQLKNIRGYVETRLGRSQQHLSALNGMIGRYEQKLRSVPSAELGLAQLVRESEVYNKTYSYLLERQQQAGIIKASTLSKNRILDVPRVPTVEYSPRVALRAGLSGLGLLLGTVIVLLRSVFSRTFQTESEVQHSAKTSILASIPRRRRLRTTPEALGVFDAPADDRDWRFTEAFRGLRTNLYRAGADTGRGAHVLLVTSPSPDDGKTTCVQWLAAALAADERRVLVVDADLRKEKSAYETLLGDGRGLQDVLRGDATFDDVVQYMSLPQSLFAVVSSGGGGPPELLTSSRMQELIDHVRPHFDFVLIDAPSFPFVSDALVLCAHAETVLSVIRLDHTSRRLAEEHLHRLSENVPRLAVVVNGSTHPQPVKAQYLPSRERQSQRPPPSGELPFDLTRRRSGVPWPEARRPIDVVAQPAVGDENAWFESYDENADHDGGRPRP